MIRFVKKYSEVILWNGALILLGLMPVTDDGFSLCLLHQLGFSWCPGCGLGHAIHYALHFEFRQSFAAHVLGIPATAILFYQSCKSIYQINKNNYNYGSATTSTHVS